MFTLATLDRQSALPLYYQIQQRLLKEIRDGSLKPGQLVPSEQEISARLGVSRMTARQALKSLCDLGVAYSERGKGTFVFPFKLEKGFRQVLSFTEETRASGSRPGSKVLSFESVVPDEEVAGALRLKPKAKVFRLRRVRLVDSAPVGIECSYLPMHLYPDLDQKFDPSTSLYRALEEFYGIQIHLTDEVAEAGLLDASQARLLRASSGAPAFFFTRTSYVRSGEPVEFVKSVYRGDRYKIVNRLTRQTGGTLHHKS
jgi:GntR family transcriptional regulator, N-acetylglucosamine utilization regulator